MSVIQCSLVSDGSTDAALLPIIRWVVAHQTENALVDAVWADLRRLRKPPRDLADKIVQAVKLHPCDILFIHRDAERQPPEWRVSEIEEAVRDARNQGMNVPHICVVPVRMQEAWLLFDIKAIRHAADNPNGRIPLKLPPPNRIESIPDPKCLLHDLLRKASELQGRRLRKFRPEERGHLVSEHLSDMAVLRALPAFQRFEANVRQALRRA